MNLLARFQPPASFPDSPQDRRGKTRQAISFLVRREGRQIAQSFTATEAGALAKTADRFKRLDISDARELVGYAPLDDSTAELPALRGLHLRETLGTNSVIGDGRPLGLRAEVG